MSTTPENLIAAQRAVLETSQSIGAESVKAAAKLLKLQCEAVRELCGTRPQAGIADDMLKTMNTAARATDYLQQMSSLWLSGGEMVRLLQMQAERTQSLVNELMRASFNGVPAIPTAWPAFAPVFGPRLF